MRQVVNQLLLRQNGAPVDEEFTASSEEVLPALTIGTDSVVDSATDALVVKDHVHRYARDMGSECKEHGCTEVRKTPFSRRARSVNAR